MHDNIIFVDFDGTITEHDTLSKAMELCLSKELFDEGMSKLQSGEWTLKKAVKNAFENISSTSMPKIMDYVATVPIRKGFKEMLLRMKELNIPLVVISGGLKPYVEKKLEPYRELILDIHSVDVDTSGEYIKLLTPYEGESDLLEKTEVMKLYKYKKASCIGDGLTDIRMALSCQKYLHVIF